MESTLSVIKCGIIGYGKAYYFGRAHGQWINSATGLKLTAICSRNPEGQKLAAEDFPGVGIYDDVDVMLNQADIDLVSVVTPQYTHFGLVMECLKAGRHVVVEKPMALTSQEADGMINEARRREKMLAIFHNRRYDGNYLTIKEIVDSGIIGQVFHIEVNAGHYGHRGYSWHSKKEYCGNALYEWGSHAAYWVLNLIPGRIKGVTGFFHKLVWKDIDLEDQVRALLLFENGAVADITNSHISALKKPLWHILGTKGGIVDTGEGAWQGYLFDDEHRHRLPPESAGNLELTVMENGRMITKNIVYKKSMWEDYYKHIAAHLLRGVPLPVEPEEGRRVISILETAERSAKSGKTEEPPFE